MSKEEDKKPQTKMIKKKKPTHDTYVLVAVIIGLSILGFTLINRQTKLDMIKEQNKELEFRQESLKGENERLDEEQESLKYCTQYAFDNRSEVETELIIRWARLSNMTTGEYMSHYLDERIKECMLIKGYSGYGN